MKIFFVCAVMYILTYICVVILQFFSRKKWGKKDEIGLIIFFGCLCYVSFFAIPSKTDDLYRWYANVNMYRKSKALFGSSNVALLIDSSKITFIFDFSTWLVAQTNYNGFLPVIWLGANFTSMYIMIKKFVNKFDPSKNVVYSFIGLYFALSPFVYSLSGLRYNTICSFAFLAIYMFIFEEKVVSLIILTIIGTFIHQAMPMFVMILFICILTQRHNVYKLIVFWSLFVNILIQVLGMVPIEIFQFISKKLEHHFYAREQRLDIKIEIVWTILLILIMLSIYFLRERHKYLGEDFQKYSVFLEGVILFYSSVFFNDILFQRGTVFLGCCLLPYNYVLFNSFKKKNWIAFIELFFSIGLIAYYLVTLFTYFRFDI